jgi:hypothetical protein
MREACKYAIEQEMIRIRGNIDHWERELAFFLQDKEANPVKKNMDEKTRLKSLVQDKRNELSMCKEIQKWKHKHTACTFQLAGCLFVTSTTLTLVGCKDKDLH